MNQTDKIQEILDYVNDNPINIKNDSMKYVPFDKLDSSRLPDVVEGLQREDVMLDIHQEGRVNKQARDKFQEHMADVTVGMLYLACKGLDEAHDIVLPYSWPLPAFTGPPITNSPAAKESEYCHAMVHRLEGPNLGELGMYGYDNACFWFGRTGYHRLFPEVKKKSIEIAKEFKDGHKYISKLSTGDWNPDDFTMLCKRALVDDDKELWNYCNKVTNMEWNLLFQECNKTVNPVK